MPPYYQDDTVTLWHGDALTVLRDLPSASVDCCVTSPPYFGLRDYGVDGQLGAEASPAEYVENMRALFAEVRRVLADDGTLWLNLGDSYSGGNRSTFDTEGGKTRARGHASARPTSGLPGKNLLGIPWRVAFALQDDDSSDVYELRVDAPSQVRQAAYLETCRIRTPKQHANTTASTPGSGGRPTGSKPAPHAPHGTTPTETRSADTAASTTSSTASKRSSEPCAETQSAIGDSDSPPYSTTAASTPSAHAAASGATHSSASTTSEAAAGGTASNCATPGSTSGSTSDESPTPTAIGSSATTATAPSASTGRARTRASAQPRLLKRDIPPADLPHFRLVRQDRWILRNSVIWHKPNAMPESVTDRLSTRHENVFMFSKRARYWFDLDPIREPHAGPAHAPGNRADVTVEQVRGIHASKGMSGHYAEPDRVWQAAGGRNPGDVWSIPTQPFPGAHFATMPLTLAERCVMAGCKPGGTVLDPFSGSGTTGLAAAKHGRRYVGIDLNADYLDLSLKTRLAQPGLDFEGIA